MEKSIKRQYIRYEPDMGAYAQIDPVGSKTIFSPTQIGLVINEAQKGCGLVLLNKEKDAPIIVGQVCQIKIGSMNPISAEVRWKKILDEEVIKIGLMFLN